MRRLLAWVTGGVAVVLLIAAAWLAWLVRSLDTPAFERALLERAGELAGAPVRAREVSVGLVSGVSLEDPAIANPAPFAGDFLAADAFVLRYRLWPLLRGRVEVQRLSLERPRLSLAVDARGVYNYERLGPREASAGSALAAPALPLRLVLSRLSVEEGSIVMTDAAGARLLRVEGLSLSSAFEVEGGLAVGDGRARARTVDLGGLLRVSEVTSPATISKRAVRLAPVRGRVAGGEAEGEATVDLTGGLRFRARVELRRARVETMLREAGMQPSLAGALQASASFEGRGGLDTLKGSGTATIQDCRVPEARLFSLLARVLDLPELARPELDECRVEFVLAGRRLATPIVRLSGPAFRLTGEGRLRLDTGALDHDVTLALAPRVFAKVTRRELRGLFRVGSDGFASTSFHVSGTLAAPQTDLVSRLGRAAAGQAVEEGLRRIFRRP